MRQSRRSISTSAPRSSLVLPPSRSSRWPAAGSSECSTSRRSRHGFGELGMLVDRDWRGRGVGSALVQAAVSRAHGQGLHELCLEVFAHNTAAIALYRRSGFVEEGRRADQYRRASGELWDSVVMGLAL